MEVRRAQVLDLFDSIADLRPIPRAGLDLAATIAANAQRAQLEAEKRFSLHLTVDDTGVKVLRSLLAALHRAILPNALWRAFGATIPFAPSELVANVFGSFLGEALRARVSGEWRLVRFGSQTLVALCSDKGNQCFVIYKAGKQFMLGDGEDVWVFYSVMAQKLAPENVGKNWAEVFRNQGPVRAQ